ncbi:D-glucarate permease [Lysinibacillus sphaericus]|nr:D-glucarate permease [Lysinibacillus sphaericus]
MAQHSMREQEGVGLKREPLIPYWVKLVTVFFLGWVALYATRTVLNPVMGDMQSEFGLTQAQLGLIVSVNFIGNVALQVPSGLMGDKIGRKRVLVPGFLIGGLFAAVAGGMPTFFLFMAAWFIVGAGQGTYYGPQYGISSSAIPAKRITLGSAIINSGMAFGTSIGYYLSSYSVSEFGLNWRVPFFIIAGLSVAVAILMYVVVKRDPSRKERQAAAAASENPEDIGEKIKLSVLFKNKNLLVSYIIIFASIYGFFMLLTWLPYYLEADRGIVGGKVAFVSSIVPWAAIPGSLLLSMWSDKIGKRKPVLQLMLPIAFLSVASIVFFESMTMVYIALILYGIFGKISTNPILVAVVADNAPKQAYSTAFSVYNFLGMSASILAPYITGFLADKTGSLASGFYLAAILLVVGFIASFFLDESNRPNVADEEPVKA